MVRQGDTTTTGCRVQLVARDVARVADVLDPQRRAAQGDEGGIDELVHRPADDVDLGGDERRGGVAGLGRDAQ